MTTPASAHPPSSWSGDPERDFVIYQLIEMARHVLDEYFSDDERVAEYQAPGRRTKGRKQKAASSKPEALERWHGAADSTLVLLAHRDKMRFSVKVEGEHFKAEVALTYDPGSGELLAATVAEFEGDTSSVLAVAISLMDELSDPDLDENDLEDLLLSKIASRFPAANSQGATGPAAATAQDTKQVDQLARGLASGLARDKRLALDALDQAYLEANPQSLWPILDGLVAACQDAAHRDENLIAAYQWLLANQLELIRYRTERGWTWADKMLDEYQDRISAIAKSDHLSPGDLFSLAAALTDAKIPVDPKVSEAFFRVDPGTVRAEPSPELLRAEVQPLIDQLGEAPDPFVVIESLSETAGFMPAEFRAFLAHEFALSPYPVLRDAVPLMLLDSEAVVRRATAALLEQTAAADTLSPAALRRTIILRNWIPEDDRAGVDRAIRKARTKGVICAQWNAPPKLSILALPIDGSGAYGLILTTKPGKTGLFGGVLLKQNFGLRDIWCDRDKPRHEIGQAIEGLLEDTAAIEVERHYLDVALQHHLAIGLSNGRLPTPALLAIAESVGGVEWRASRLDIDAEIARVYSELDPAEIAPADIAASLKRSGEWLHQESFAESWFENDAEVSAMIDEMSGQDDDAITGAVLSDLLEKRRGVWTERFLLMALWARAAKSKNEGRYWRDFLILAHELSAGRPLEDVPIMAAIAQRTVSAALSGTPF